MGRNCGERHDMESACEPGTVLDTAFTYIWCAALEMAVVGREERQGFQSTDNAYRPLARLSGLVPRGASWSYSPMGVGDFGRWVPDSRPTPRTRSGGFGWHRHAGGEAVLGKSRL
jgi:hypothetical protein